MAAGFHQHFRLSLEKSTSSSGADVANTFVMAMIVSGAGDGRERERGGERDGL